MQGLMQLPRRSVIVSLVAALLISPVQPAVAGISHNGPTEASTHPPVESRVEDEALSTETTRPDAPESASVTPIPDQVVESETATVPQNRERAAYRVG